MSWIPELNINTWTWGQEIDVYTGAQVGIQCQERFWTAPKNSSYFSIT